MFFFTFLYVFYLCISLNLFGFSSCYILFSMFLFRSPCASIIFWLVHVSIYYISWSCSYFHTFNNLYFSNISYTFQWCSIVAYLFLHFASRSELSLSYSMFLYFAIFSKFLYLSTSFYIPVVYDMFL